MVVQKYGGTTVVDEAGREALARRVRERLDEGRDVVVVVSAMGRKGSPYATDTLIELVRNEGGAPPRDLDLVLSCGEIIAAVVVVARLFRHGMPAVALTGAQAGLVTDSTHGDARLLSLEPARVRAALARGLVPVVAGFQGVDESGEVTTLGRGGSDTTAAALGAALGAELVEIFTDVDGIKTADPRIVPDARTLPSVTYEEVFQMAHEGARVVHPRAVELAMRAGLPLLVRDARGEVPGTLVSRHPLGPKERPLWAGYRDVATGVTHRAPVALLRVPAGPGEEPRVFRAVADAGISIDLINIQPELKSFTVPEDRAEEAANALRREGFAVEVVPGCAKVSVVGSGIHGRPGVTAAIVEALVAAGVRILASTDSHVTVSCLVPRDDMERAVRALHAAFDLARDRDALQAMPEMEGREE
ncbi:MAG: aspartate kinase [Clostridia bacterium]|nr:aspartate kinase [Clostridia bacterium]